MTYEFYFYIAGTAFAFLAGLYVGSYGWTQTITNLQTDVSNIKSDILGVKSAIVGTPVVTTPTVAKVTPVVTVS